MKLLTMLLSIKFRIELIICLVRWTEVRSSVAVREVPVKENAPRPEEQGEFPYVVVALFDDNPICLGVVQTNFKAVMAAKCFKFNNDQFYDQTGVKRFRLKVHDYTNRMKTRMIRDYHVSRRFSMTTYGVLVSNFAVATISEDVPFPSVGWSYGLTNFNKTFCIGVGLLDTNNLEVFNLVYREECGELPSKYHAEMWQEKIICMYVMNTKAFLNHDLGGPLVCEGHVRGILVGSTGWGNTSSTYYFQLIGTRELLIEFSEGKREGFPDYDISSSYPCTRPSVVQIAYLMFLHLPLYSLYIQRT